VNTGRRLAEDVLAAMRMIALVLLGIVALMLGKPELVPAIISALRGEPAALQAAA
jgi:hypothetical protein